MAGATFCSGLRVNTGRTVNIDEKQTPKGYLFSRSIRISSEDAVPMPSPSTPFPLALVSEHTRIVANQTRSALFVPSTQQLRNINVERTVRFGVRQQLVHSIESARDGIRRRPRGLQEIETYLAGLEMDVWMAYRRFEHNRRGRQRVILRDLYIEIPCAGCQGTFFSTCAA